MPDRRKRRGMAPTFAVVPLLAAGFVAGCGSDDDNNEQAFCTARDQNGNVVVVENRFCDSGTNGSYFWYFGGANDFVGGNNGVQRGARLRPAKAAVAGKAMVVSTNRAALANRGGFGSSTKSSGVGRSTASSKGGFGGGGGRSGGG